MRLIYLFLMGFVSISFSPIPQVSTSPIDIHLSNIRNAEGYIYIFIYTYKNQYPYEPYKYYKVAKNKINNGHLTARISNLNIGGNCAISLIDDENSNEDLDRWLGLPTEGYGFSNNVTPLFSLPDYEDLIINLSTKKTLNIKVQYLL